MNYLVANFKSHKTLAETRHWFDQILTLTYDPQTVEVIACPPAPYLLDCADLLHAASTSLKLGIQDISPFPFGAYTGAISAPMITDWVNYAIVGHSERRRYFGETSDDVLNKVEESLAAGITPIVCVDEPYLEEQLRPLKKSDFTRILVAYEPVSAIGSGNPDTPSHADEIGSRIKHLTDNRTPVLYGGSVNPENIGLFLNQTHINGALVGSASLNPDSFTQLIKVVSQPK